MRPVSDRYMKPNIPVNTTIKNTIDTARVISSKV